MQADCYALRYHINVEASLLRVLRRRQVGYILLTFRRRLPKRKHTIVTRRWFPGYLFVRFDVFRDPWQRMIREAPGAIEVLGEPTPIPADIIRDLELRCPDTLLVNDEHTVVPAGSEVEITDGAFRGMTGVVAASKGDVVWVELIAFNRPTRAVVFSRNILILR
jgi:transcription antitermination factor NusG